MVWKERLNPLYILGLIKSVPHLSLAASIYLNPIGFLIHTHSTLSPVGLAPHLNITADFHFLCRSEVLPTHVWASMRDA